MLAVPAATPLAVVMLAGAEPTVATEVLPLIQMPPSGEVDNAIPVPGQKGILPAIAEGVVCTVIGFTDLQPVGKVYVICSVPAAMPFTTPVPVPMVKNPLPLALHVPPAGDALAVIIAPLHTEDGLEILPGKG